MQQLKSDIRSVLIAAKDGMSTSELQRDYQQFVGGRIPFANFGFSSLHELLEDIPDVCRISSTRNGIVYHAVADESTQNIKDLVSRQKSSGSKKTRRGHSGGFFSPAVNRNNRRPANSASFNRVLPKNPISNTRTTPVFRQRTPIANVQLNLFRNPQVYRIQRQPMLSMAETPKFRFRGINPNAYFSVPFSKSQNNQLPEGRFSTPYVIPQVNSPRNPMTPQHNPVIQNSESISYKEAANSTQLSQSKRTLSQTSKHSQPFEYTVPTWASAAHEPLPSTDSVETLDDQETGSVQSFAQSNSSLDYPRASSVCFDAVDENTNRAIIDVLYKHPEGINLKSFLNEVQQKIKNMTAFENVPQFKSHLQHLSKYVVLFDDRAFPASADQPTVICQTNDQKPTDLSRIYETQSMDMANPQTAYPSGTTDRIIPTRNTTSIFTTYQTFDNSKEKSDFIRKQNVLSIIRNHPNGLDVKQIPRLHLVQFNSPLLLGAGETIERFLFQMPAVDLKHDGQVLRVFPLQRIQRPVSHQPAVVNQQLASAVSQMQISKQPSSTNEADSFADVNTVFPTNTISLDPINRSFRAIIISFDSVEDFFVQPVSYLNNCHSLFNDMKAFYSFGGRGSGREWLFEIDKISSLSGQMPCAVYWNNAWLRAFAFSFSLNSASIKNSLVTVRLIDIGIIDVVSLLNVRRLPMRFARVSMLIHRAYMPSVLKPVHSDFLIKKCKSCIDRCTFDCEFVMCVVDDPFVKQKGIVNRYRRRDKTPIEIVLSSVVSGVNQLREPLNPSTSQCETLSKVLLRNGLVLPSEDNSFTEFGNATTVCVDPFVENRVMNEILAATKKEDPPANPINNSTSTQSVDPWKLMYPMPEPETKEDKRDKVYPENAPTRSLKDKNISNPFSQIFDHNANVRNHEIYAKKRYETNEMEK